MKNMKKNEVIESKIEQFGGMIRAIGENLLEAGKLLVEMLKDDPEAKAKIQRKFPEISVSMLNQLEAVGRGQMHPRLALAAGPGHVKMRGLPYSDQERYLEEPVPLLVDNHGAYDTLLVKVHELTPDQARQVFAADHLRSAGEQRAYLEDLKQKKEIEHRSVPLEESYKIHRDGSVEFKAGVRLTRKTLMNILQATME